MLTPDTLNRSRPMALMATLMAALLLAVLTACGGGGGAPDITGTGDDGSEEGEIGGYGSVIVNGTHYETDAGTVVEIDGVRRSESDLRLGMVVQVDLAAGDVGRDGARARAVRFAASLEGQLESLDADRGSFEVLDVAIDSDSLTRFFDVAGEPSSIDALSNGEVVQISGFTVGSRVLATYVRQRPPRNADFVVRGVVENLDDSALRFDINGLNIDYSAAGVVNNSDVLENGDLVEAQGERSAAGFSASRVSEVRDAQAQPPQRGGLRGIVTRLVGGACPGRQFALNGNRAVRTSASTQYESGSCAEIANGRELGAIGSFDSNGVLNAERIVIVAQTNAFVQARVMQKTDAAVTSADAAPQCTLRVLGDLDIRVTADTRQGDPENDSAAARSFSCNEVELEDVVTAIGNYDAAANRLDAQIIQSAERSNAPTDFGTRSAAGGQVQTLNAAARQFEVLGSLVQISDDTDFRDSSEAAFFSGTQPGEFAAAAGIWNGTQLNASWVVSDKIDPSRDTPENASEMPANDRP